VALLALVALALVLLENDDFLAAFVFEDGGGDGRACERRGADLERVALSGGQHIRDRDGVTLFRVRETIHGQDVALGDDELLALGFDGGFHKMKPRNKRVLNEASKEIFCLFAVSPSASLNPLICDNRGPINGVLLLTLPVPQRSILGRNCSILHLYHLVIVLAAFVVGWQYPACEQ